MMKDKIARIHVSLTVMLLQDMFTYDHRRLFVHTKELRHSSFSYDPLEASSGSCRKTLSTLRLATVRRQYSKNVTRTDFQPALRTILLSIQTYSAFSRRLNTLNRHHPVIKPRHTSTSCQKTQNPTLVMSLLQLSLIESFLQATTNAQRKGGDNLITNS